KFAEGYAGMGASEDPREQGRVGRGPAVRLRRRRYVLDRNELAAVVEKRDRAVSARIDSQNHAHCSIPFWLLITEVLTAKTCAPFQGPNGPSTSPDFCPRRERVMGCCIALVSVRPFLERKGPIADT